MYSTDGKCELYGIELVDRRCEMPPQKKRRHAKAKIYVEPSEIDAKIFSK